MAVLVAILAATVIFTTIMDRQGYIGYIAPNWVLLRRLAVAKYGHYLRE